MFKPKVKQVAIQSAVVIFFIMAVTGWFCGHPISTCASRAFLGGVVIYFLVRFAGQIVIKVLLNALVEEQVRQRQETKKG